jgi:hypothetical protein
MREKGGRLFDTVDTAVQIDNCVLICSKCPRTSILERWTCQRSAKEKKQIG